MLFLVFINGGDYSKQRSDPRKIRTFIDLSLKEFIQVLIKSKLYLFIVIIEAIITILANITKIESLTKTTSTTMIYAFKNKFIHHFKFTVINSLD